MGIFKFRKFSVCDDQATMKVGTDAVLLGTWAEVGEDKNVLDIGTGSGVIAMIIAQRTGTSTHIDAVELQSTDAHQAKENVSHSPWPEKVSVFNTPIQTYQTKKKYDLIFCNPPYFKKSLLPPKTSRQTARHDVSLSYADVVDAAARLLGQDGRLNIILPPLEGIEFITIASQKGLFVRRYTKFFTRKGKNQERTLLEFRLTSGDVLADELLLYEQGIQRSEKYKKLTAEFYLDPLPK